jgi:hypothetical protein
MIHVRSMELSDSKPRISRTRLPKNQIIHHLYIVNDRFFIILLPSASTLLSRHQYQLLYNRSALNCRTTLKQARVRLRAAPSAMAASLVLADART